jgi:cytochrome c oxidase subunit II
MSAPEVIGRDAGRGDGRRSWRRLLLVPGIAPLAGCGPMSILDTAGPGAAAIAGLWWWLFWMTIVPATAVIGFLLFAVSRRRRATEVSDVPASRDLALILWIGAAMPLAVILVLMVQSFRTGQLTNEPPQAPSVRVEIVGHKFWWEVRYPDLGIVTANEIHLPVGESTVIEVWSEDVIHSVWVPALHGKIDANPGRVNVFWLQPDRAGIFRGQCAEFCGTQHALMGMIVVAEPRPAFDAWVARRRLPAAAPADTEALRGAAVFAQAGCGFCHTVSGLFEPQVANTGPDLTHLASRRTLAAATMPNTPENLRDWILNPHSRKPGVRMPDTPLPAGELDALVTFLRTLE